MSSLDFFGAALHTLLQAGYLVTQSAEMNPCSSYVRVSFGNRASAALWRSNRFPLKRAVKPSGFIVASCKIASLVVSGLLCADPLGVKLHAMARRCGYPQYREALSYSNGRVRCPTSSTLVNGVVEGSHVGLE